MALIARNRRLEEPLSLVINRSLQLIVAQRRAHEQVTALTSAGNVLWPLADHLGTIRDIADRNESTGVTSVTNHRRYDSFGILESESNAAVDMLFGYTGRMFDEATGLKNNLNRWYESKVGQWLSEDPIGFEAGDPNLRRYVFNKPLSLTDPSGLAVDSVSSNFWKMVANGQFAEAVSLLKDAGFAIKASKGVAPLTGLLLKST
jgi:RHS repeat-associated protein